MSERQVVTVETARYALDGRHLWVTISGGGRELEYQARNSVDARNFIETTLREHFAGHEVITTGDTQIFFTYQREGD